MVENRRVSSGKTIQRQVLYLGEMGGSDQAQWNRALEAFDEGSGRMTQIALFPEGQAPEVPGEAVQVHLRRRSSFTVPGNGGGGFLAGARCLGAIAARHLLA